MKFVKLAAAALALSAAPALANDQVTVGATVYDPDGAVVGTIVEVEGGQAVVDTGKHKVPLGLDSYGESDKGPTITVGKSMLDQMMDTQLAERTAARDAALVAGASVMTGDHQPLGTILEVDGNNVVVARGGEEADKVTLLREYFSNTDHGLMARLTMAQIDAAVNGSATASTDAGVDAGV